MTGIEISGPSTVNEQEPAQFTCTGKYSDATTKQVQPVWGVDVAFASISDSGELLSDDLSADALVNITASFGGKTATASITVLDTTPTLVSLAIEGPGSVDEGMNGQFSCYATYSDESVSQIDANWSVSSTAATIDSTGLLLAGSVDADVELIVWASSGEMTAQKAVTISDVPSVVTGITISGAVFMDEGSEIQLDCIAEYSDGTSSLVAASWSENSAYATIENGLLQADDVSSDQSVTVGASYGGFADTHVVLIKYVAPTLENISISGDASVAEESTSTYVCTAHYSDGTSEPVTDVIWSESSSYASIGTSGTLTTGDVLEDESFTLTASYGGKTDSISVTILYVEPDLVSIEIAGATSVDEGEAAHYTCTGYYSDSTSKSVEPIWSVNSSNALIGAGGWLTVQDIAASETVLVSALLDGVPDSLSVTLNYVAPSVVVTGIWIDGPSEMNELSSITLSCKAAFSDGTTNTVGATWADNSSKCTMGTGGKLTTGNFDADGTVVVGASFGGLDAAHEVAVAMVDSKIVYPLEGFEDKTIMAVVYEHGTGEWSTNGPFEGELVFERKDPSQWYWVSVIETNTVSGETTEIQANWFHL
ncbi:hypothetical protein [Pontiella sp.]|uniref:hypothetical protein n=3 Tax=Pontiella sp. TaxID=2837462 RepID=UPI003567FD58